MLYIDFDGFRAINDTVGHQTWDEILVSFAERLRHVIRPTDVLAPIGGYEFAVLLVNVDESQLCAIGDCGPRLPFEELTALGRMRCTGMQKDRLVDKDASGSAIRWGRP